MTDDVKRNKILIVDDDSDVLITFKTALECNDYTVDAFTNPLKAISNFKANIYDLLLLDLRMPVMDGFELYDEIKKIDNKVKVCFMSAYDVNYQALRSIFTSPDIGESFIKKPIKIPDLIKHVKKEITKLQ